MEFNPGFGTTLKKIIKNYGNIFKRQEKQPAKMLIPGTGLSIRP
jgi:hypothetical protein